MMQCSNFRNTHMPKYFALEDNALFLSGQPLIWAVAWREIVHRGSAIAEPRAKRLLESSYLPPTRRGAAVFRRTLVSAGSIGGPGDPQWLAGLYCCIGE